MVPPPRETIIKAQTAPSSLVTVPLEFQGNRPETSRPLLLSLIDKLVSSFGWLLMAVFVCIRGSEQLATVPVVQRKCFVTVNVHNTVNVHITRQRKHKEEQLLCCQYDIFGCLSAEIAEALQSICYMQHTLNAIYNFNHCINVEHEHKLKYFYLGWKAKSPSSVRLDLSIVLL